MITLLIASLLWGADVPVLIDNTSNRITEVTHTLAAKVELPEDPASRKPDFMAGERLYEELMVTANRNGLAGDPGSDKAVAQFNGLVDRYNKSGIDNPDFPAVVLRVGEGTSWAAVHAYLDALGPFEA